MFYQTAFMLDCSFQIILEGNSADLALLKFPFTEVKFNELNLRNESYELPLEFLFRQALPVFPRIESFIQFTIYVIVPQYSIQSNQITVQVELCRSGNALVADSVYFYTCFPCLSGSFANISICDPTKCSKCPTGRYSN